MEKIYSNRIGQSYIQFLDQKFGKAVTDQILQKCGMDRLRMADSSGFFSLEESAAMEDAIVEVTGEKDAPYLAGRNLPKSLGTIGGTIIGVTSPNFFMRTLGQVEERLALKTINKTVRVGRNRFRVDITFRDGFKELPLVCRNRIGSYESAPLFFGLPFARVEHSECAHKGADHCVYFIDFPEYGFSIFNRIFQVLSVAALAFLSVWLLGADRPWALLAALGSASAGFLSFAIYRGRSATRSLESMQNTVEGLSQQNKALELSNFRILSLQDLTTELNTSTHVQDICEKVVDTLVTEFRYGSSQIWLLDAQGKYLYCPCAVGYTEELRAFILNTRFRMDENRNNPYGLLVQTLQEKRTLIVNDPAEAISKLSSRTQEFLRALNLSSFIITPLIHEGKPQGILAAEHHHGEKIENQDRMLFQSISNIVATALVKAELFEKMEHKIDQRTRELESANQQLLAAKEMAIQSEKLSSLGQMAAGVAHEINNPLNFLVNIIPDVRRDVEALEKIRSLALQGGADTNLAAKVRELDARYDLETHLEEKDFVFDRIQKALDKSTRIANSLKVFSRSSSKETITREGFATMLQEVVDLIPQKVKGDTRIELNIPPELGWKVNKNEMEQAFLALVNNAIDAMGQKGTLRIEVISGQTELALAFKDEGPGIPAEALKRIFDPFYTTKPPGKGTGLGLTIASEIVRKYGGALSAISEPGKGATFFIRFRKSAEDGANAASGASAAA